LRAKVMPGTRAGIGDGVGVGVIVWMEAIIVVSIRDTIWVRG